MGKENWIREQISFFQGGGLHKKILRYSFKTKIILSTTMNEAMLNSSLYNIEQPALPQTHSHQIKYSLRLIQAGK